MWRHTRRNQISFFGETYESIFIGRWASVQSTTGSRGVRISGSDAGYTVFRGSVKGTGYPLHSPVSPSLPLPCVTLCHNISTGLYIFLTTQCGLNLWTQRPTATDEPTALATRPSSSLCNSRTTSPTLIYAHAQRRFLWVCLELATARCGCWITQGRHSQECPQPVSTLQAFAPYVMSTHRSWQTVWAAIMVIKTWKRGVVEISVLRISRHGRLTWRKLYFQRLA